MGVKTTITLKDLEGIIPCNQLHPSHHGVSDTVYFTDQGVLKLFETTAYQNVLEEQTLLMELSHLPVTQPCRDLFELHGKPCLMYTTLEGSILDEVRGEHIAQIADFMRQFHHTTWGRSSSNPAIYERSALQTLIHQTGYPPFQELFDAIELELKNDGIIHGDLFLDNALFHNDRLSGIIDFSEACEGDFKFDLAVVAISWCLDGKDHISNLQTLLDGYNDGTTLDEMIPYLRYALLYYATTRYIGGRDFQILLDKMPLIDALEATL